MGTRDNEIKDSKKITGEILKSFSSFIEDKIKIINIPKITKDKCLKKKHNHLYPIYQKPIETLIPMKKTNQ